MIELIFCNLEQFSYHFRLYDLLILLWFFYPLLLIFESSPQIYCLFVLSAQHLVNKNKHFLHASYLLLLSPSYSFLTLLHNLFYIFNLILKFNYLVGSFAFVPVLQPAYQLLHIFINEIFNVISWSKLMLIAMSCDWLNKFMFYSSP